MPAYSWLTGELNKWADNLLFGSGSRVAELFRLEFARPLLASAKVGNDHAAHKIWVLIVLEHWLRVWT